MRILLAIVLVAVFASMAHADDEFDPEGWTLLSEQRVKRQTLRLGVKNSAVFDELVVLSRGIDVVADSISVNTRSLSKTHDFKDGARAWHLALDVAQKVRRIDLTFDKVPKKSRGAIQVFGRNSTVRPVKREHGMNSSWKSTGWEWLGKDELDGRTKAGFLVKSDALVNQLTITASGSDLMISGLVVSYADGTKWTAEADVFLGDGAREHTYQLPDDLRAIISVYFNHVISSGTGCRVALYGRDTTKKIDDDGPTWDGDGWTLIGEDDVDLVDDEVLIDREDSTWSMVAVVAVGDEVTLEALEVQLAGKADKVKRADLDERLTDGSRTRVLEIPGKRRAIEKVRLQYKKHRLDASTRVQIYAR